MASLVLVTFKDVNVETDEVIFGQILATLPETSAELLMVMNRKEVAEKDGTMVSSGIYAAFFVDKDVLFIPKENLIQVDFVNSTN